MAAKLAGTHAQECVLRRIVFDRLKLPTGIGLIGFGERRTRRKEVLLPSMWPDDVAE